MINIKNLLRAECFIRGKEMKLFENLKDIEGIDETAVALGNFDGVHYGHQALIRETVEKGKAAGLRPAVFTFSNNPKNLLRHEKKVKNIMYQSQKIQIIENLGVDYLFNVPFTKAIMDMTAPQFIDELLIGRCRMKTAFCGFNYRFAYKAEGTPDILKEEGLKKGFSVREIPPFKVNGDIVSSSLIRALIASGQVEKCMAYMGRNYSIGGEVVLGNRLGRRLGFPTSNLVIDPSMVTPPDGVYATYCVYNGVRYPSVTNVGMKPTVGRFKRNVETHIFNFSREIYGKHIIVEFIKKMRDEVKFDTVKDLAEQVLRDLRDAKDFHTMMGEKIER